MRPQIVFYTCSACGKEIEVALTPGCPAQTYGPPEHCWPAEPDEIEPENCTNCDAPIDVGTVSAAGARDPREYEHE